MTLDGQEKIDRWLAYSRLRCAAADRRLAELLPQLQSGGPLTVVTADDSELLGLANTDELPTPFLEKLREAIRSVTGEGDAQDDGLLFDDELVDESDTSGDDPPPR